MLSAELDRVKVIKVKQPWALHLVRGIKDCENRSWRIESGWIAVASSKAPPTKRLLAELEERTRHVAGYTEIPTSAYQYQHILGLVRVKCCESGEHRATVWHNPPDYAWMVQDAWEFKDAIPLASDDKFQTSVGLSKRPRYKKEILERFRVLDSGAVSGFREYNKHSIRSRK